MKFYDCRTAPSPRRGRMFIAEKGLDIPTVQVDLHLDTPTQMLTKQLLRLSEEEQKRLERIKPLQFPKFLQTKMNPQKFLAKLFLRQLK